jgi:hypothetical protein
VIENVKNEKANGYSSKMMGGIVMLGLIEGFLRRKRGDDPLAVSSRY